MLARNRRTARICGESSPRTSPKANVLVPKCLRRSGTKARHVTSTWVTVSGSPQRGQHGLGSPHNRKRWVASVCPILRRLSITSSILDFLNEDAQGERRGFMVFSLHATILSQSSCHFFTNIRGANREEIISWQRERPSALWSRSTFGCLICPFISFSWLSNIVSENLHYLGNCCSCSKSENDIRKIIKFPITEVSSDLT